VVLTVYDIITRELLLHDDFGEDAKLLEAETFMDERVWEKHPQAKLNRPAQGYRHVLSAWVKRRAEIDQRINHFSQVTTPLSWSPLRVEADMLDVSRDHEPYDVPGQFRRKMIEQGRDVVKWERPGAAKTMPPPKGQRLLATGELVHDDEPDSSSTSDPE
jgi:hypothetical protein